MRELQYVKTDRNGTKYFYDWNCPRCGGAGYAQKWQFTGLTCFECGGTGERRVAKVVKEYTPEYWAKLEARREARAKKYAEEHADEIAAAKAEQERKEAEWRKAANARTLKELGIGENGVGFVHVGNTYPVKDAIKANGGRWTCQAWVAPVAVRGKGYDVVEINVPEFLECRMSETEVRDIIFCVGQRGMSFAEAKKQAAEWQTQY